MRSFFYRLSWDKQYLKRSLMVGACSILAVFVIAVGIVGVYHSRMFLISEDGNEIEEIDKGPVYELLFGHQENNGDYQETKDEDNNGQSEFSSQLNNSQTPSNNDDTSTSHQDEQPQSTHVHSWNKVVDSAAWTEHISAHVGYQYRCNNCGYTTDSASLISNHCSRLSHSFSQSPKYEDRTIYHPEVSHMECECGASQ